MKFALKQVVGALATPLALALLIVAAAAIYQLRGRQRTAKWLCATAAAVVYLGALAPIADALLSSLEDTYPPLREAGQLPHLAAIVVLGSSYVPRDNIPASGALDSEGLARIVEGVKLARRFPDVPLVVSGGARPGLVPSALGYARLARELGIDETSLIVVSTPLDTAAESHAVAEMLGTSPFILVTSASHMPRAVRLLQRAGANPIPAPTAQRAGGVQFLGWRWLLPSSGALRKTDLALHEYVGLMALSFDQD